MAAQTACTTDGHTHQPITAEATQAAVGRHQPPPLLTPEVADMQRELAKPTGCYKCRQLRAYLKERLKYQATLNDNELKPDLMALIRSGHAIPGTLATTCF